MNKIQFQIVCDEQFRRLDSIRRDMGISDKLPQMPLFQTPFQVLADELVLCPDDAAARRALARHPNGWPVFAFFGRNVGAHISNEQYRPGDVEPGLCPFFYIGRFVASFYEMAEDCCRKKRDGDL
jgi:hypothetical protein